MAREVILTKGLPGSGKSTWAKQQIDANPGKYKRINKDSLRAMLDNSNWSKHNEKFILKTRDSLILSALEDGFHVIVDDTNFEPVHEKRIRDLVAGKAIVSIKEFDISLEECIKRDLKRFGSVGEAVIRKMYDKHLAPKPETIEHIEGLRQAIIVDLDGTLALLNGRNPYDASTCEQDGLCQHVFDIINRYRYSQLEDKVFVILMSGREEKYRPQTELWLAKHDVPYKELFMRPTDDIRKDSIVKRELFDNHVRGKYNIDFVLDDRNQVVEMWRKLGLVCLQVAEGNF